MAIIHISLQAKGGVGKSFLALMLSMFYRHIERPVKIFDTDPANATLFGFPALEAEKFEIMKRMILTNGCLTGFSHKSCLQPMMSSSMLAPMRLFRFVRISFPTI
ncbi:TPA: hypothetical protein ACFB2B_002262 [Neisseria gonorrhoeae]